MAASQPSLKGRALRLLSGREYSRAELERKLVSFEEVPGSLAQALDALQAKGFISEQRVIESVLHRRAGKLGGARLRQELQGKGLDPDWLAQRWPKCRVARGSGPWRYGARSSACRRLTLRLLRVKCVFWPRGVLPLRRFDAWSQAAWPRMWMWAQT